VQQISFPAFLGGIVLDPFVPQHTGRLLLAVAACLSLIVTISAETVRRWMLGVGPRQEYPLAIGGLIVVIDIVLTLLVALRVF